MHLWRHGAPRKLSFTLRATTGAVTEAAGPSAPRTTGGKGQGQEEERLEGRREQPWAQAACLCYTTLHTSPSTLTASTIRLGPLLRGASPTVSTGVSRVLGIHWVQRTQTGRERERKGRPLLPPAHMEKTSQFTIEANLPLSEGRPSSVADLPRDLLSIRVMGPSPIT